MKYLVAIFSLCYISILWWFAVKMLMHLLKMRNTATSIQIEGSIWAFTTLAIGDTAHVLTRVLNWQVGSGDCFTAVMITCFYLFLAGTIIDYADMKLDITAGCILALVLIRIIMVGLPENEWNTAVHPYPWYEIRNWLLMGIQAEVIVLIVPYRKQKLMKWIILLTGLSLVCLIPTTFFIREYPMLGMLMIPKSFTYLVMAYLMYKELFKENNNAI
jgi:hypothetical protein